MQLEKFEPTMPLLMIKPEVIINALYHFAFVQDISNDVVYTSTENNVRVNNCWVFEIVNNIPYRHFAPFYKVRSIHQAKDIFKALHPNKDDVIIIAQFLAEIDKLKLDLSKDMYLTVYKISNIG